MAVKAFIFIESAPGRAKEIAKEISKIDGIQMAHSVTGPHDVIALVEAPDVKALGELIVGKVQVVGGVQRTQTSIVAD
jgi:DNA-binding Lrp family transcriptional regulator